MLGNTSARLPDVMSREQFLAAAQEQGVLAGDDAEKWQRELWAADDEGRFTFTGIMFGGVIYHKN